MAAVGRTLPPGYGEANRSSPRTIRSFLKAEPKALGTVQIMIGVVTILFGIVLVSDPLYSPISVISGNVYWASIVYIITGSLSVAAENKLHPCLVQGSLGMNVVSAMFSAVGIGLLTGDFILYYNCYYDDCYRFEARSKAISGVLLVFAVLQFIISICISAFACKATCCSEPTVPVVTYANQFATGNPHVSVATISNQVVKGNPQNMMYIPQPQVTLDNPMQQNLYQWQSR